MSSDDLYDLLSRLTTATGMSAETIALKACVPVEPVAKFLETQEQLTDKHAEALREFAERLLSAPVAMVLAMVRDAAGVSLAGVQDATGLSKYSVSKWERGARSPQSNALIALWKFYSLTAGGLQLEWLMTGDVDAVRAFLGGS